MGWGSGSDVMHSIIAGTKKRFPHDREIRRDIYEITIWALDGHDWDTHCECLGLDEEFDEALKELHPSYE